MQRFIFVTSRNIRDILKIGECMLEYEVDYFFESMEQCLFEFELLYNKDKFISKKEYDKFLEKYEGVFRNLKSHAELSNTREYHKLLNLANDIDKLFSVKNKLFIDNKLNEYKEYFDNMFIDIDPNIVLDEEQRRAILIDEDYSLIVAGAGSGKTTTMAAKAKYLVDKRKVDPKTIILLAFTNKAADELRERIVEGFGLNIDILTFHKLGMKFLRRLAKEPILAKNEYYLDTIIIEYIKTTIFKDKKRLRNFVDAFKKTIGFDENVYNFESFDDYFKDYVERNVSKNKDKLEEENIRLIASRTKTLRTIKNETVKSLGEVNIANWLTRNSVDYKYEEKYLHSVSLDENRGYVPDFTIGLPDTTIYIEFFGLSNYYFSGTYSGDTIDNYNNLISKKRELHSKYGTDLIELYYDKDSKYIDTLRCELEKRGVLFREKNNEEIYRIILNSSPNREIFETVKLISLFIRRFKSYNYSHNDFDLIKNKTDDSNLINQIDNIIPIYNYYQSNLKHNWFVDFEDMINMAYQGISKLKHDNTYLNYRYVIVDEYQDISRMRFHLIKNLSKIFDAKICAVGDDWQNIFSFSGAEISLFTKFYDLMGYGEIITIFNTYRNSQELIDIAGEFVSKNSDQTQKKLLSFKHLENPVEIVYYKDEYVQVAVLASIIVKIHENNPKDIILLLGRYNKDKDILLESGLFRNGIDNSLVYLKKPNIKMDFLTIHSSKGLGYDQVILLNAINAKRGFPSKIEDDPLIKLLYPETNVEEIKFAEERRLFYVALTRTKNKAFILAPIKEPSEFVEEIQSYPNVYENLLYIKRSVADGQ